MIIRAKVMDSSLKKDMTHGNIKDVQLHNNKRNVN